MAFTPIDKSTLHFNTKLFVGNGSTNAITGVGFQPDLTWLKSRSGGNDHQLYDVVRGVTKYLRAESNDAEGTAATGLTAFNTDGYTLGSAGTTNNNSANMCSWNWKAGNSAGSSNTDGTINTTSTSVNTTAGFSISKYTGTGANATVGHGLGVAPKAILMKNLDTTSNWIVYHHGIGNTKAVYLNDTSAQDTSSVFFNDTTPTSTVFSLGNSNANANGDACVAYCFAEKLGFSKFGYYQGNGSTNGPMIYTGFKPGLVITKRVETAAAWIMMDNKRPTVNSVSIELNPINALFEANTSSAEASSSSYNVDYLSNGFKIRNTNNVFNNSSGSYIYMAFAANPLVSSNGVPATAR